MNGILYGLLPLLLAAVCVVLVLGLFNMLRGGELGRSQKLMRWRVVLQFGAIVAVLGAAYFMRG